jgi:DNA-binding beta-propeller fold protein YncE
MFFKPDGTELYVVDRTNNTIHQATLSTGFDLSTASDSGFSLDLNGINSNCRGMVLNEDGTRLFLVNKNDSVLNSLTLSIAWRISTAVDDNNNFTLPTAAYESLTMKPDGTRIYIGEIDDDKILQYNLSTANDLSTAELSGTLHTDSTSPSPRGLYMRTDGRALFTGDGVNDEICRFSV